MSLWLMGAAALMAPTMSMGAMGVGAATAQSDEARSEEGAKRETSPISCPYRKLPRTVDRDALASLARSGFQAKTDAENHALRMVGESLAACQADNGWGDRSRQAAYRYLTGRVLVSNARYQLRDYKVTTAQFHAAHAALSPAAQQSVARGSITSEDMTVAWKALVAGGAQLDALPQEERAGVAQLILQGLAGVTIMGEAETAFRAR